jgi:acetyl-CoA carboxylase carboxyltransferase component
MLLDIAKKMIRVTKSIAEDRIATIDASKEFVHHSDMFRAAAAENPEEVRQQKIAEYREKFANPYVAAARGYIDDVIDPAETRAKIILALEALESKRVKLPPKKHGNIPL